MQTFLPMSELLTKSPATLTGRCRCGAVAYRVSDAFEYAMYCHCSACRLTTGSAFKPLAGIKRDQFHIVEGEDSVLIYGSVTSAHDMHCATCGSLLYSVVREGKYVHVAMGTLEDEPTIRPSMHIFVGSKANGIRSRMTYLSLRSSQMAEVRYHRLARPAWYAAVPRSLACQAVRPAFAGCYTR